MTKPIQMGFHLMVAALLTLTGCAPSKPATSSTLVIFAAASLSDAATEMAAAFEQRHPGVKVRINFAGSQTLLTQILEGAEADVFAPASEKQMKALVLAGLVSSPPSIQATNSLAGITSSSANARVRSMADLDNPGVKVVLAASQVPAGEYAVQVLENLNQVYGAGYSARVLANTVSYENSVKAVAAKVLLGEADAAIVYLSDAAAAGLVTLPIPADANLVARFPIAALSASRQPGLAEQFVLFVLSADGQAILKKWGFQPGG